LSGRQHSLILQAPNNYSKRNATIGSSCAARLGAGEQPPAGHLPFARYQKVGIDSCDQRYPVFVSGHERHGPRQQRSRDLHVDHLASDRRGIVFSQRNLRPGFESRSA
jgi:hypothetical protein